jgi:hypothetical protein
VTQTAYPFPQTPATVSRWARMSRLFSKSTVLGNPDQNPYGLTVSGLTATIGRGTTGTAEAWVRGFMHTLDAEDHVETIPANTDPNPRIDRYVLRLDLEAEDVTIVRLQGTPAATPAPQPLTQTDTVWDLPLWRFTVPGNSGAPLTALVSDRYYADVDTGWQGYPGALSPEVTVGTWIGRAQPVIQQAFTAVCWSPELRLFVAVGDGGKVVTSPDGITWTERNSGTTTNLSTVVWCPELGLFVAAGGNPILTSPDGITWTQRTTGIILHDLEWSPQRGIFVGVGPSGRLYTSPDGITWTNRTGQTATLSASYDYWSVCWSPERALFVTIARYGSASGLVYTSPDGITWTNRMLPIALLIRSVCWSPRLGLFVAVADSGSANPKIVTSPDGITWTLRVPGGNAGLYSVCWADSVGQFIAVGTDPTSPSPGLAVMTSSDGAGWTQRLSPNPWVIWRGVCWSDELDMAVAVSQPTASINSTHGGQSAPTPFMTTPAPA